MNKKGFTLIELLAVLAIISILATMGFYSIRGTLKTSHEKMLETKLKSVREAAIVYGQEKQNDSSVLNFREGCSMKVNGENIQRDNCTRVTIQELIDDGYFETEETDEAGNKIVKNDVTGGTLNNENVWIYKKNNRLYAETEYKVRNQN